MPGLLLSLPVPDPLRLFHPAAKFRVAFPLEGRRIPDISPGTVAAKWDYDHGGSQQCERQYPPCQDGIVEEPSFHESGEVHVMPGLLGQLQLFRIRLGPVQPMRIDGESEMRTNEVEAPWNDGGALGEVIGIRARCSRPGGAGRGGERGALSQVDHPSRRLAIGQLLGGVRPGTVAVFQLARPFLDG